MKKGKLAEIFKAAVVGAGVATAAAIVLPVITVSAPVLLTGAAVGALIKIGQDNQP